MLVYGDPSFEQSAGEAVAQLRSRVKRIVASRDGSMSLASLRLLLIHAGQVEQGFTDALRSDHHASRQLQEVTDRCAAGLIEAWSDPKGQCNREHLIAIERVLDAVRLPRPLPSRIQVKVPEGYAFYSLYPEQYAAAAGEWMRDHSPAPTLVIGIRSIGTGLSAVVMQALRRANWPARRITVRPEGNPFDRSVWLDRDQLGDATAALVVDEGPGLSGSSMASVARALMTLGLAREQIAFLPAHANSPVQQAPAEVRQWWEHTARYPASDRPIRPGGAAISRLLARHTPRLPGCSAKVRSIQDVGGGKWRAAHWRNPNDWPAACAHFERSKYRCILDNHRSILWKFAGIAIGPDGNDLAHRTSDRMRHLARRGWCLPPLGTSLGYVATRWIHAKPLAPIDANSELVTHLGQYISDASGPPLQPDQQRAGFERLVEMMISNVQQALGDDAAEIGQRLCDSVADVAGESLPTSGDGRLAPCKWLRTDAGRIYKVDCGGHEIDHTMVGCQPITWDIAGAIVEWELDDSGQHLLIDAVQSAGRLSIPDEMILFHCMAYAAFRMGQCVLCSSLTRDADERVRLLRAAAGYREMIPRRFSCHLR